MACRYIVNNKESKVLDEALKYVEDVASEERSVQGISKILEDNEVIVMTDKGNAIVISDTLTNDRLESIKDINLGAKEFFGVTEDLITVEKVGSVNKLNFNTSVLKNMTAIEKSPIQAPSQKEQDEDNMSQEEEEDIVEDEEIGEDTAIVEARRNNIEQATEQFMVGLQQQVDRLERLPESKLTASKIAEMEVLRRDLKKVKSEKATLDDYMDFVDFVVRTSERAERLMGKITDDYTENYKNISNEKKSEMLKTLSELKKTIDTFYDRDDARSLIFHLQDVIIEMEEKEEGDIEETVYLLDEAARRMQRTNEKFLESGLAIQTDLLLSFAPPEINKELASRIAGIEQNKRIDGLNRWDPRYAPARLKGMPSVLELNILQLKEKMIGRESILRELKETHKDQSALSAFFSPLVYNKEASIQLFAEVVRKALTQAHDETLEFKYDVLQNEFREYKNWRMGTANIGEDNVAKLYDPIIETIMVSTVDAEGNRVETEALTFVQEYAMNKFNTAKGLAFDEMKELYGFPTDPAEYDEYWESDAGKAYSQATAMWYRENTEQIDDAYKILVALKEERNNIWKDIQKLKNAGHSDHLSSLYLQYNNVKYEIQKSYRNGTYIGKLSRPKRSKVKGAIDYSNPKFKAMPAEAKKYYDVLLTQYKQDQKRLGRSSLRRNSWEDFSYILPSVRKSAYDRAVEKNIYSAAKDLFVDGVKKTETDTEFGALLEANGEVQRLIPQYFTNLVNAADISKDITNSMIKFNDMANRYKAKSDILGVVTMMETAIKSRKKKIMQSTGNYVLEATAKKLGFKGAQHEATDNAETNTYKQLKSFVDNIVYGLSEEESKMFANKTNKINAGKLSSAAITLTALSTLSTNWLQATNQLVLDKLTGTQEAIAGDFYSVSDLAWARTKMSVGLGQFALFSDKFLPKFGKKNKLAKFLETFDAFQSFGNEFGQEAGTAKKKALRKDSFMVLQQTAEMLVVSERALAMAHATKGKLEDSSGKVLLNKNGKEAHLYDLLIENSKGRLVLDPRVANFNKDKFIAKLHGMMKRTNQLKGNFDRVRAQRGAFSKLVTLFRNYLVPGLRKRFGNFDGAMIDVEMAAVNEGYYASTMNELINAGLDIKEGKFGKAFGRVARPGIFFRSKTDNRVKANMRRMYFELIVAKVTAMLAMALVGLMDDDDEESYAGSFAVYQLLRLQSEWTQFRSTDFIDIVQDPTAAANPVRHLAEMLQAMWLYGGYHAGFPGIEEKEVYYQNRAGRWKKGDAKVNKEISDFAPVLRGIFTSTDPEEARKYYDLK